MHTPLYYMVAFWIVSSAIRAMPDPQPNASGFYRWSFAFLHVLLANWDKVAVATMPKLAAATQPLDTTENK